MSTKFVSKNSNYMIVLKPGIEGNRALGTHAIPGLYIKFLSGVVDIKEESVVAQMRAHPSFGTDFIEVKESEVDPFSDTREEVEPDHFMTEIKYGHAEKAGGSNKKAKLTPQMKKFIEGEAMKMLPGLLKANPKVLKDIIMSMADEMRSPATQEVKTPSPKAPAPVEADQDDVEDTKEAK